MKTKSEKWISSISVYIVSLTLIFSIFANNTKAQKHTVNTDSIVNNAIDKINQQTTNGEERIVKKQLKIDFRPTVNIETYNIKTEILPAKGNEIIAEITYTAIAEQKSDIKLVQKNIEANLLQKTGSTINIKLDFYKTMNTTISSTKRKTTIKLNDGSKVKLAEFKLKEIKIYVPADLDLNVNTKYSRVNLAFSINGNLNIDGYNCQFKGKAVSNNLQLNGKYSKFEFSRVPKAKLDLYESTFKATEVDQLAVISKYSSLDIKKIKTLKLDGYEDKITSEKADKVSLILKYCDINIAQISSLDLNAYEGSFNCTLLNNAIINSKYLNAEFGKINTLSLAEGYENNFKIQSIDSLSSTNGKHNEFNISVLNSDLYIDGYEEEIEIEKISEQFNRLCFNGKYLDININIPKNIAYKIYGNIQYPDLNLNKNDYNVATHDKVDSSLKFEYYKNSEKATKEIKIAGYEVDLILNYY